MKALGIDIGSLTTEAVILDDSSILSFTITPAGDDPEASAKAAVDQALANAEIGPDGDLYIVSTGIGGKLISFSQQQKAITTCLARGIHWLFPEA
ncbi:MAG: BadF/BadG/BcrA/BcrD ATPase family protein, partial [Dehalococcoidia bacterium]